MYVKIFSTCMQACNAKMHASVQNVYIVLKRNLYFIFYSVTLKYDNNCFEFSKVNINMDILYVGEYFF